MHTAAISVCCLRSFNLSCPSLLHTQRDDDANIITHTGMQLCKGGELHASFEDNQQGAGAFTYGDVGRIAVTMLVLADAMHSRGFVHCDLKPENFCLVVPHETGAPLVDNLRLIDFGLSQRVRGGQAIAGLAGSIPYMAPEIKTRMYDHKVCPPRLCTAYLGMCCNCLLREEVLDSRLAPRRCECAYTTTAGQRARTSSWHAHTRHEVEHTGAHAG